MRAPPIAVLALALSACNGDAAPPQAYLHFGDALASIPPFGLVGNYPCRTRVTEGGTTMLVGRPVDQCYRMQPARRFRGIWLDQFEGSIFVEGVDDANAALDKVEAREKPLEWLSWSDGIEPRSALNDRIVQVDFIGRRTAYRGRYGHMGMARSQIVVDRILSARQIGTIPPEWQ